MKKKKGTQYIYSQPRTEAQQKTLECAAMWASFYRANMHRFAMDYLHVSLKLFQATLLVMMNRSTTAVLIACRGLGKSFIAAIFCVCRCILYPGTKICIASGTRGQSINVLEKIMNELVPMSPELKSEIDETETNLNNTNAKIQFKNGSYIKVVTASDSARSNRANLLIIDEFRMVKKAVIDTILKRFLSVPRHPKYLDKPEYAHLKERNKTLYLSSAYYQDHWSFTKATDTCRFMLDPNKHNFICGFPYQLGIADNLFMEEEVEEQMLDSDFNEIAWYMEMDSIFYGDKNSSFFGFKQISKNRKIPYPMLPDEISKVLPSASMLKIQPKKPGEKRILSADIALMASTRHQNDATAIFINQLIPTMAGRYANNIVYTESNEGMHTESEALKLRKMFEEFNCDYLVLDVRNVGLSIYDLLAREMSDPETGEVYPPLSCCNNPDLAARCIDRSAAKVVWAVNAMPKFNSDCALLLREGFRTGRIRLLLPEYDAEDALSEIKGYATLGVPEKATIMAPYVNTTLLIDELVNLQHDESAGFVKITERGGSRKDRYSSLSYNHYVATQIEKDLRRADARQSQRSEDAFIFRAPKKTPGRFHDERSGRW